MKKSFIFLIHIIIWIPACTELYVYLNVIDDGTNAAYAIVSTARILTKFISFYLFYFLLFPLISRRAFSLFILNGLLIICIVSFIAVFGKNMVLETYGLKDPFQFQSWTMAATMLFISLYSGLAACFVRGSIAWYADLRYKKALEKKNLETELALLKAQLNPHFLFNTLNNIDILIEKSPEKASVYLKKLSDMIRFMLYQSPLETIPLTLEIKYMEQYIELQKIRTLTPDFIVFRSSEGNKELHIAPMLFIPFIENAFKHTTNKKKSNAINIEITVKDYVIFFSCSNIAEQSVALPQEQSGLGLTLIQSRLELLYRGKYKLDIDQSLDRFSVTLVLDLNENELHYS